MNNRYRGFSLIELMITISIIGILATLSIPAYGDYLTRARIADMLNAVGPVKETVSEYILFKATTNLTQPQIDAIGIPTVVTNTVSGITVENPGAVFIRIQGNVINLGVSTDSGDQFDIILTPNFDTTVRNITWVCSPAAGNVANSVRFLPSSCK